MLMYNRVIGILNMLEVYIFYPIYFYCCDIGIVLCEYYILKYLLNK